MDLLNRYLQAVKKHLPIQRQDDIVAELRANMESQLEDKEAALGRPLTTGESEDWLRQMGSPVLVALKYQPQQYLIGPAIFPMYWVVMRLAFLWSTVIYAIVNAVLIVTQTPTGTAVLEAVLRFPGVLFSVATWVTLVFAAFEFATARYPQKCPPIAGIYAKWSPGTLPPIEKSPVTGGKRRSYSQAVAEIVFGFLFLGWFVLVPQYPVLMFGPGAVYYQASPYQLADVWTTFFWLIVALNLVQLCWRCIDLWRGSWQRTGRVQHLAVKLLSLVPLVLLLSVRDQAYVTLKHPALDQSHYGPTLVSINHGIHTGLLSVCAIAALTLTWEIVQSVRQAHRKREISR